MARSLLIVLVVAKAYAIGRTLHLLIAMLRNSLPTALVNYVRVVMQLPEYSCQFSCDTLLRVRSSCN